MSQQIEQFISDCKNKGLSVTYQRLAVFKCLMNCKNHPTAEEIFTNVKIEHPTISLATVYKNLEVLAAKNIISKVTPLHNSVRFDGNSESHHHAVCVKCKNDMSDEDYEKNVVLPRRFIIEVKPGTKKSEQWGDIVVFDYDPIQILPDKAVAKIIEDSSQFKDDFEKQFNVGKYIAKSSNSDSSESEAPKDPEGSIPFQSESEKTATDESETKESEVTSDDLAGDIDLGF